MVELTVLRVVLAFYLTLLSLEGREVELQPLGLLPRGVGELYNCTW